MLDPIAKSWNGTQFKVDPATLNGAAGRIGAAYDEVNTTLGALTESGTPSADFGAVLSAHDRFAAAWLPETSVFLSALGETVQKLLDSAQLYQETDASSARLFTTG
ncbi:WXG100 family type VII secretion target [Nocardia alni]|uniref:WXG100 family type VII secretion target n=1 Tax=Nocardia alni TaxID=2815723 RepID=UPI001C22022B|nr:hypothetical protein [Nocardia alni]